MALSPTVTEFGRVNGVGVSPPQSWQQQVAELKYRLRIERAVYEGAGKVLNAFKGPQRGAEKTTKHKVSPTRSSRGLNLNHCMIFHPSNTSFKQIYSSFRENKPQFSSEQYDSVSAHNPWRGGGISIALSNLTCGRFRCVCVYVRMCA